MMDVRAIEDGDRWDSLLLHLGEQKASGAPPHVLQSWAWGEVKSRWGWSVERLSLESGGRPIAAAQVMWRRIGGLPLRIGYVPKGPFVASDEPEDWSLALSVIELWSRQRRLAFVKIDADVHADDEPILSTWRQRGWRPSSDQIQFRNTMRSDIRPDEAAILASMKSKTRYNIRLADRKGVAVCEVGADGIEAALRLYRETALRQGFAIRASDYYRDAWRSWLGAGQAEVLLAEHGGEVLAAAIPVRFGRTAWYLYGASSDLRRDIMAPYAVMWASMKWARSAGCTDFDWWGGPDVAEPSDPLWGVFRFKQGFGAELELQTGAWDYPTARLSSAVFRGAAKARSITRMLRG